MTSGLRRFIDAAQQPKKTEPQEERCEMCAVPVGEDHGHVVDLNTRGIMCTCRPCYLLFTWDGAGGQRFCAVPERYRYTANFKISRANWDTIGIPVRMAFFFKNTEMDSTVAFYPSPAGATESLLSLDDWRQVLADNPDFADAKADVEALLVNREGDTFECFLIPIDVCYTLVGIVKMHWRGFDGGTEAWEAIEAFFADLRERSEHVDADSEEHEHVGGSGE